MIQRLFRTSLLLLPIGLVLVLATTSCDDNAFTPVRYDEIGPYDTTGVESVTAPNGLTIYFHEEGHGDVVTENHAIRIRYTGRTTDGDIFDSTFRNDVDVPSTLQVRGMVTGFMQGLAGYNEVIDGQNVRKHAAREGSRRTLVIPPSLGYGGSSNHSLRADTLVFDIDVVAIATDN